jgi:peroxiredoxin
LLFGAAAVAVFHGSGRMSAKLGIGDTFPKVTLNLVDGGTLELPDGVDAKYRIFLFYRGHW